MHEALPGATGWLAALVTGPLATGLAMLAVMGVGLSALTGTLPKAQMLRVLLGLTLLFVAPHIVRQLVPGSGNRSAWADPPPHQAEFGNPPAVPQAICWTCR